jgi:hypothetical protein
MKYVLLFSTFFAIAAHATLTPEQATARFYSKSGSALQKNVAGTIKVCGELRSVEDNRQAREDYVDASGKVDYTKTDYYELRLDCNWDGVVNEKRWLTLPAAVRYPDGKLSPRRGVMTKFQQNVEKLKGPGAVPYACVQAVVAVNPCEAKVQKAQAGFYRATQAAGEVEKFVTAFKPAATP